MKQQIKTLLVWAGLIVVVLSLAHMFSQSAKVSKRTYYEFVKDIEENSFEFKDTVLEIEVHKASVDIAYEHGGNAYEVVGPASDELYALLNSKDINYKVEPQEESVLLQFAVMWVPMILICLLYTSDAADE